MKQKIERSFTDSKSLHELRYAYFLSLLKLPKMI